MRRKSSTKKLKQERRRENDGMRIIYFFDVEAAKLATQRSGK